MSCSKDPAPSPVAPQSETKTGTLEIIFEPYFQDSKFKLNNEYTTLANEVIKIDELKYFITNMALAKADASEKAIESYPGDSVQCGVYLVDFNKLNTNNSFGTEAFKMRCKVEAGEYIDIRYDVSVPRAYNLADISKNPIPLNMKQGMYWSWNSGFKYMVVNGSSNAVGGNNKFHLSLGVDKKLSYNFRSILLAAQRPKIVVQENKTTTIRFKFDVSQIFVNTDGTPYSIKAPIGVPDALNPSQVHGGHFANVIRANAQQCIELVEFKTE
jgi:hypothetical protein